MFEGSSGKISTTCSSTTDAHFSPQSRKILKNSVVQCLRLSPVGDCSKGVHGPIRDWDVSTVTDMHAIFSFAQAFNADISNWDVSAVTKMNKMFTFAKIFNKDISKWDVSAATDMTNMFYHSFSFDQVLCGMLCRIIA